MSRRRFAQLCAALASAAVVTATVSGFAPSSALARGAGPASNLQASYGPPQPVVPPRTPRPPISNQTLTPENCGPSLGRWAWHVGIVQCNRQDSGAIVAIHPGGARTVYAGTEVQRELEYVDANWYTQGEEGYAYIPNEDCANFVSQAMHAAGWNYTPTWHPNTLAWVGSTSLRRWILASKQGVVELKGIAAFSQVKVGDIAQFDWHNTHIRNHTAIVTAVQHLADGSYEVWVGEHTDAYEFRNVREMVTVTHPGATVYFLSLPA